MHADEFPITDDLVRELLRDQFPAWADRLLRRVPSTGTVNAIFRLGDDLAVRLPRTPRWHDIEFEVACLEQLQAGGDLPLAVPRPIAIGEPACDYPFPWGVFEWIDGDTWSLDRLDDPTRAAAQLAEFVHALQDLSTTADWPRSSRGGRTAMAALDEGIRQATDEARSFLDADRLLAVWDDVRTAPGWSGDPRPVHGDLLAPNLLVRDGQLHAVIDWAGASIGDPARDLIAAWTLFDGEPRAAFQDALPFDDDTWTRAKAWSMRRIHNVAYYAATNPEFSADAVVTIDRVLADHHP